MNWTQCSVTHSSWYVFLLSWPRSIALLSKNGDDNVNADSFFYSEYVGRISKGAAQAVFVTELTAPNMQQLDHLVQQSSIYKTDAHVHFYGLE